MGNLLIIFKPKLISRRFYRTSTGCVINSTTDLSYSHPGTVHWQGINDHSAFRRRIACCIYASDSFFLPEAPENETIDWFQIGWRSGWRNVFYLLVHLFCMWVFSTFTSVFIWTARNRTWNDLKAAVFRRGVACCRWASDSNSTNFDFRLMHSFLRGVGRWHCR